MKNNIYVIFMVLFLALMATPFVVAQDASDSIVGVVSAQRDASGAITSATLEAQTYDDNDDIVTVVYQIAMNEMGKQLAEKCDGLEVRVDGQIKNLEGQGKEIEVSSYEETSVEIPSEPGDDEIIVDDAGSDEPDVSYEEAPEVGSETE